MSDWKSILKSSSSVAKTSFAEIESLEHFKKELLDYLDYYNNRRSKVKQKG